MVGGMKPCSTCGEVKPLADFQVRRASKDGRTASCKVCLRLRDKERYNNDPSRKQYCKDGRKRYPLSAQKRHRRYIANHPEKRAAHIAVGNALRDGKIARKEHCEVCGSSKTEAHHHDYARQLDVWWLCNHCHRELHRLMQTARST